MGTFGYDPAGLCIARAGPFSNLTDENTASCLWIAFISISITLTYANYHFVDVYSGFASSNPQPLVPNKDNQAITDDLPLSNGHPVTLSLIPTDIPKAELRGEDIKGSNRSLRERINLLIVGSILLGLNITTLVLLAFICQCLVHCTGRFYSHYHVTFLWIVNAALTFSVWCSVPWWVVLLRDLFGPRAKERWPIHSSLGFYVFLVVVFSPFTLLCYLLGIKRRLPLGWKGAPVPKASAESDANMRTQPLSGREQNGTPEGAEPHADLDKRALLPGGGFATEHRLRSVTVSIFILPIREWKQLILSIVMVLFLHFMLIPVLGSILYFCFPWLKRTKSAEKIGNTLQQTMPNDHVPFAIPLGKTLTLLGSTVVFSILEVCFAGFSRPYAWKHLTEESQPWKGWTGDYSSCIEFVFPVISILLCGAIVGCELYPRFYSRTYINAFSTFNIIGWARVAIVTIAYARHFSPYGKGNRDAYWMSRLTAAATVMAIGAILLNVGYFILILKATDKEEKQVKAHLARQSHGKQGFITNQGY